MSKKSYEIIERKKSKSLGVKTIELKNDDIENDSNLINNTLKSNHMYRTMKEQILGHLETYGSINAIQANKLYNCLNLSQIINHLRKNGYDIVRVNGKSIKNHNTVTDRTQAYSEYIYHPKKQYAKKYRVDTIKYIDSNLIDIPDGAQIFDSDISAFVYRNKILNDICRNLETMFYLISPDTKVITKSSSDGYATFIKLVRKEKRLFRKAKEIKTSICDIYVSEETVEI